MWRLKSFILLILSTCALNAEEAFALRDGDRVLFLGNSFFERALDHGYLETSLALRWPDRNVTFRNVGWDGDTIYGHSRAGGRRRAVFGDAKEGFARMREHVQSLKPTVIFLSYGFNEAFEEEAGLVPFCHGLRHLIAVVGSEKTRFVLLSPMLIEEGFGAEPAYVAQRNVMLKRYSTVMGAVAGEGNHFFVNLSETLGKGFTANGIHPSAEGYRKLADVIGDQLQLPPSTLSLASDESEKLRATIVKKNTLYYHRWRPRNDAFVYGERKDEQKIAQSEPEQFEPFIAKQEAAIRVLLKTQDPSKS
ncbi:MAG: lysophospholipase L1-like esterase [Verrucomicrobiales bacterium]|jgi:lysophospholipase L1-like esterase